MKRGREDVDFRFRDWYQDDPVPGMGNEEEEEEEDEIVESGLSHLLSRDMARIQNNTRARPIVPSGHTSHNQDLKRQKNRNPEKPTKLSDGFGELELGQCDNEDEDQPNPFNNKNKINTTRLAPLGDLLFKPELNGKRPWIRPSAPVVNCKEQDFIFQHTDTTQDINVSTERPIIRTFGVTKDGHSVVLETESFRPYFYARIRDQDPEEVREKLEKYLGSVCVGKNKLCFPDAKYVISMDPVQMRSMCGWHRHQPLETMYRFTMAYPSHVKKARDSFEFVNAAVTDKYIKTFEANVPFELRFMVDTDMNGCQWIRLRKGTYKHKMDSDAKCQYVFEMSRGHSHKDIDPIPVNENGDLAPMRMLSFDIEAMRDKPGFCQANEDPVVCICVRLNVSGQGTLHEAVFYYVPRGSSHQVNQIENATMFVFDDERKMMLALTQYIQESDPECFTGWNITGFDWPYLSNRAKHFDALDRNEYEERMRIRNAKRESGQHVDGHDPEEPVSFYARFMNFSRVRYSPAYIREQVLQSKAYGAKIIYDLICDGRFNYDGLDFMYRGQMKKYRSYTLNAISSAVLKDTKVDVDYSQIPRLYKGSDEDRTRLGYYCLKDARLPLQILEKLMAVVNGVEQARVTGVPIKWLLSRGQGIKTFSNILRYKEPDEVVPSRSPKMNNVYTAGGYVRDPLAGYYTTPVATLDFSSLYPSIMQAYNICYSTVESLAYARKHYKEEDYWVPPIEGVDFCFVKEHIRKGVLPRLLDTLLGQRRYVKGLMKEVDEVTQALYHAVLNGRQMALKVVCNSVYGFLKAFILIDPRLMSAVTAWGQEMIKDTADSIVEWYKDNEIIDRKACDAMGIDFDKEPENENDPDPRPRCKYSARIIYGDTDSVMVDFGDTSLQECWRLGNEAAERCTKKFVSPNKLICESIKLTSLFMKKKRYGSLEIEGVFSGETLQQARARANIVPKGLESKRRDNAKIGSETQTKVLDQLLRHENVEEAVRITKQVIEDINMDRVDMSKYIISKGLSKTEEQYEKGGSKLQHTDLRRRIKARSAQTGEVVPQTGDRVPFIIKAGLGKKGKKHSSKAYEMSEDPVYAQLNAIPINTTYYIEKQVMAATLRIFTGIWEPQRLPEIKSSMPETTLESLKAWKELFAPHLPHMKCRKKRKTRTYGMGKFAEELPRCLYPGCSTPVKSKQVAVCGEHTYEEAMTRLQAQLDEAEAKKAKAWDTCRKCAGGGFDEVTCSNKTCDNFFHRTRTIIDVEDLCQDMERLKTCSIKGSVSFTPVFLEKPKKGQGLVSVKKGKRVVKKKRKTSSSSYSIETFFQK